MNEALKQLVKTALAPRRSVVVSACAGSGKTWLLVSRILRALLDGAQPSEILAITFTRKAAQEMQARLNEWLHFLARAEENQVIAFLLERGLDEADAISALPRARCLYEVSLNSRPALTLDTFHGWFLQLLQRAPLRSGNAGPVALLAETSGLVEEAWQSLAQQLGDAPESLEARCLNNLLREYGLHNTRLTLENFLHKRGEWWAYTRHHADPVAAALTQLQAVLGVGLEEPILQSLFTQTYFENDLQAFAALLEKNQTKTDTGHAAALGAAHLEADVAQRYKQICSAFFTAQGERYARKTSAERAQRLGAQDAQYLALHASICARLETARDQLLEQQALRFNYDALVCGTALLTHFQTLKSHRGVLDFVDVECDAERLLDDSEHAAYMQYKLDARYRHILLDEFQDTNPLQWQLLLHWFDAALAAERAPRVFLVGDPKQSIYRFRGADARIFDRASTYLRTQFGADYIEQDRSFRSAQPVLDVVNSVFGDGHYPHFQAHHAQQTDLAGGVWCLPLPTPTAPVPAASTLRNPLTSALPELTETAQRSEADQIALHLPGLVGQWRVRDKTGERLARYGDVMLLARTRTHIAVYEEALSAAGIPFLTARQGGLLESLEARDLSALLEFLILPAADLQLAHVLRTPIFDVSDAELIDLAQSGQSTWWQSLQQLAQQGGHPALSRAHALLAAWQTHMDRLPVHDLLDRIFHEGEVLARYASLTPAAMTQSVHANLLSFLELALSLDSGRYPSLPKFVDELRRLRRLREDEAPDLASTQNLGDAVRLLTVHGAKGLEAPIVWLVDTNRILPARDSYQPLIAWPPGAAAPSHFSLTTTRKAIGPARAAYVAEHSERAAQEEMNLLYVAMTRAQQYLIVSAAAAAQTVVGTWYARLSAACAPVAQFRPAELPPLTAAPSSSQTRDTSPLDATTMAAQQQDANSLATCGVSCGERRDLTTTEAMRRGIFLHSMLERLAPPASGATQEFLQRELGLTAAACTDLWQAAHAIMQAPKLVRFFEPNQYQCAWNELPLITADGELRRIDRLVEFAEEVWILDYKSEAKVTTANLAAAAQPHLGQLRIYQAALASVYPNKRVSAGLIFPDGLWFALPDTL